MRLICILGVSFLGELFLSSPAEALPLGNKAISRIYIPPKSVVKRSQVEGPAIPDATTSPPIPPPATTANAKAQRARLASASEQGSTAQRSRIAPASEQPSTTQPIWTVVDHGKNTEPNQKFDNSKEQLAQGEIGKKVEQQEQEGALLEEQRKQPEVDLNLQKAVAAQKAYDQKEQAAVLAQKPQQAAAHVAKARVQKAAKQKEEAELLEKQAKKLEVDMDLQKAVGAQKAHDQADLPQSPHQAAVHEAKALFQKAEKQKDKAELLEKQAKKLEVDMELEKAVGAPKAHDQMKPAADLAQNPLQSAAHEAKARVQDDVKKKEKQKAGKALLEKQRKLHEVDLNMQKPVAVQKADVQVKLQQAAPSEGHGQIQADTKKAEKQKEEEAILEEQHKQKAAAAQKTHDQTKQAQTKQAADVAKKLHQAAPSAPKYQGGEKRVAQIATHEPQFQMAHAEAAGVISKIPAAHATRSPNSSEIKTNTQIHRAAAKKAHRVTVAKARSVKKEATQKKREVGTKKRIAQNAGKKAEVQNKWKQEVKSLMAKSKELKKQKKWQRIQAASGKRVARIGGVGVQQGYGHF